MTVIFSDSDDDKGEEEGDGKRGSSVQAPSSPLLASESQKIGLEAEDNLDKDDHDFFPLQILFWAQNQAPRTRKWNLLIRRR